MKRDGENLLNFEEKKKIGFFLIPYLEKIGLTDKEKQTHVLAKIYTELGHHDLKNEQLHLLIDPEIYFDLYCLNKKIVYMNVKGTE